MTATETEDQDAGGTEPAGLRRYVGAWVAAALIVSGLAAVAGWSDPAPGLLLAAGLVVLTVAASNLGGYVFPVNGVSGRFSLEELASVLAVVLLPPPWAVAVIAVGEVVSGAAVRRVPWFKTVFNTGSRVAGVGLAALVFRALTGPGFEASASDVLAAILIAGLLVTVNTVAFSGLVGLISGRSLGAVVRQDFPTVFIDYGIAMTGILAAVLWVSAPAALPLLLVPTLLDQLRMRSRRERYELEVAKDQAEQANRAKSEFLSRMSHELRTPLNAVLGFGQLLELDERLDADGRRSVELILKSGKHLLAMIDEVLDISRIESGRLALDLEPVRADEVVAESIELVRPLAVEHGIRLRFSAGAPEATVTADRQRLRQVLINLLTNAVKFNHEEGRVTVTVALDPDDETARIAVTDTGPGIAAADQQRLFVPFERLDAEDREIEGTGLGLALSKNLATTMGGDLTVASTPGRGSTFTVTLPAVHLPADTVAPVAGPTPVATPESIPADEPTTASTVVYIEDNPPNVELVRRALRRLPHIELVSAPDATVGLALVRERLPDLVLLDLQLPGMDGAAALTQLSGDPVLSQIPVVVLSADASPRRIQELLAAGAVAYLTKPLDVRELLALVEESLSRPDGLPEPEAPVPATTG